MSKAQAKPAEDKGVKTLDDVVERELGRKPQKAGDVSDDVSRNIEDQAEELVRDYKKDIEDYKNNEGDVEQSADDQRREMGEVAKQLREARRRLEQVAEEKKIEEAGLGAVTQNYPRT